MIKFILTIAFFCFSQNNYDCPRAELDQPCYGECGAFLDSNSNNICDIWENSHVKKENTKISKKNWIIQISLITLILIIISEIFFKRSNIVRIVWNWLLLISMLISTSSGFLLYFSVFNEIRKNLYEIHLQISTFFFIASIYHTIKRFKCMIR